MPRYQPAPRPYELMVLFRPDLAEDGLDAAIERVSSLIQATGGTVTNIKRDTPWGRRRLAYPIQRFQDAIYVLYHFTCPPAGTRDIERELRLNEQVIRHLMVRLDE
uniref:Small ribosomal subunit protein bS6 n=1 Tax=Thermorudis sp. TaxID=1969470 RepID=A0A7C2WEC6_9BACT